MNMSNFTLLALSKTKKQHLSSITLTKNRHVYQVYVHIFIFVCLIVDFFFFPLTEEEKTSGEPPQIHQR